MHNEAEYSQQKCSRRFHSSKLATSFWQQKSLLGCNFLWEKIKIILYAISSNAVCWEKKHANEQRYYQMVVVGQYFVFENVGIAHQIQIVIINHLYWNLNYILEKTFVWISNYRPHPHRMAKYRLTFIFELKWQIW